MSTLGIEGGNLNWNKEINAPVEKVMPKCPEQNISKPVIKDGLEVSNQNPGKIPALLKTPFLAGEGNGNKLVDQQEDEYEIVEPETNPDNSEQENFVPYIAGEGSSKPR